MNKITLTAAALFVALIGTAGTPALTPASKTQLKKGSKLQGSASVTGVATARQVFTNTGVAALNATNAPTVKEVKYAPDQKHPIFFKSSKIVATEAIRTAADAQAVAAQFLEAHKTLISINSPSNEFAVKSFEKDGLGFTHIKLTQTYMGKTVWGKEMMLHFSPTASSVNGRWAATPSLPALASSISSQTAISAVVAVAKPATMNDAANQLLRYTGPTADLVVYPKDLHNAKDRWAYRVVVRTNFLHIYEYFVDATTGEIVHKTDISCTTGSQTTTLTDLNGNSQTLHTYQAANNSYYFIDITRPMFNTASNMPDQPQGALWTVDGNNSDASNIQVQQLVSSDDINWPNASSTATAASAAANGATAYSFYLNNHGRNSIDGNGGTIISVINVQENGQGMDNAFWNGQLMAYGNGQTYFKPLAGGVDVAGHEMTHGVIQATANLQYQDQSGALNESMADVFGVLISGSNYTIGSTVVNGTSIFPSGNLRDLADPHNGQTSPGTPGWQPAVMSEYQTGTDDNGGVHTNSGIPNHAFYYFSSWVGKSTADSIYYRALTKYLVTGSQFLDARVAVIQAATDLYPASNVIHYAGLAFDSVGIIGTVPTVSLDTASVNGPDWIIYQDTSTSGNSLVLIPASNPSNTQTLTNQTALYRVSVTDDGSNAYFVDPNNNVYNIVINTAGGSTASMLNNINQGLWDFVSVSRDGNRLALISKYQDTSIYVYDIPSNTSVQFHLYSPTFSQGITTNGPIYAGTADWDPTGQYIIYDEYNQLYSTDGTDISYWDIGLMQVWDKAANSYKDSGLVSKLVNSLPDGINIGNPVYSKNHTNIVAFDYVDTTGAFAAKGANLDNGSIGDILTGNSVANVPSFSGADDKITYTSQDVNSNMVIGTMPLASDYLSGNGNPATLVTGAENSVWFRVGQRPSGINAITANNVKVYPVPTSDKLMVEMPDNSNYSNIQIIDITGKIVLTQSVSSKKQQVNVSSLQSGVYLIRLKDNAGIQTYTSRIVKN